MARRRIELGSGGFAGGGVFPPSGAISSELLTWLVDFLSAFCFKKARVFLSLPILKADSLRSAPY